MPMTGTERCDSRQASPTSFITPVSVPPVTIHPRDDVAASTSPLLKARASGGESSKSRAPPVTEIRTSGLLTPQKPSTNLERRPVEDVSDRTMYLAARSERKTMSPWSHGSPMRLQKTLGPKSRKTVLAWRKRDWMKRAEREMSAKR